jgi:hypothetical protein
LDDNDYFSMTQAVNDASSRWNGLMPDPERRNQRQTRALERTAKVRTETAGTVVRGGWVTGRWGRL